MNYYFFSDIDCFLKVNGEYFGKINKNYTLANLLGDEFLEFIPLNDTLTNCNISLAQNKSNYVYSSNDYNLVYPKFLTIRVLPYKVIFQQTFAGNYCVTIITDGSIKFYLTGDFNATDELSFLPNNVELFSLNGYIYLIFKNEKSAIFIYDESGELCFKNIVDCYDTSGDFTFTITNNLYLPTLYNFKCEQGKPFKIIDVDDNLKLNDIPNVFLPFTFLNALKYGAKVKKFLNATLLDRESELVEFIGSFENFLPPVNNTLGEVLILDDKKIKVLKFIINENKISNVFIND